MTISEPPPAKSSWSDTWNGKTAVGKRLALNTAKSRLNLAVLLFLFSPLAGFGLIIVGWDNYLWILGVPLLALGLLAWVLGPIIAAAALVYVIFNTLRQGGGPARSAGGKPPANVVITPETLEALAPAMARIASLQGHLAARRRQALLKGMPVAGLVSAGLAYMVITSSEGFNPLPLVMVIGFPLLFAMLFITRPFEDQFRQAFKDEVLPFLLEKYGNLRRTSQAAPYPHAAAMGVIARHEATKFDDVFIGTYRGHAVKIADMVLVATTQRSRNQSARKTQHRVLAITLDLPRPVPATTAVLDAKRSRDQFDTPGSPYQRLELEDPVFASVYQVYSSDQVGGRALLSPAVMSRLVEAADGHDFMPPTMLAEDGRLALFLTTYNERDLFEPGGVSSSDMSAHLHVIDRDLIQVFAIVDSLIDMAGTLTTPLFAPESHSVE